MCSSGLGGELFQPTSHTTSIAAFEVHNLHQTQSHNAQTVTKQGSTRHASALMGQSYGKTVSRPQTYWNLRSISRLGQDVNGNSSICLIIDGMDRAKWSVPRSAVLAAKSLNGLQRPNLDCTGIIVHGHMVCTAFGYPGVIKGANWTCELLTFVFDKLVQSGIDLRHYEINLQSDNATKESKNNSVARMLSFYVSRGLIRCARMHYCVSGHSHEDIDQYFSLLGSYLQTQSELHDPEQFAESLRRYLSNTSVRPLERMREVVQVDQVRDWLSSRNPKYFARFSFQSVFSRKKPVYFVSPPFQGEAKDDASSHSLSWQLSERDGRAWCSPCICFRSVRWCQRSRSVQTKTRCKAFHWFELECVWFCLLCWVFTCMFSMFLVTGRHSSRRIHQPYFLAKAGHHLATRQRCDLEDWSFTLLPSSILKLS